MGHTSHRSTQVTGLHRSLYVNYVLSTKTDHQKLITKLSSVVTYDEENSPIMPRDSSTTILREVT